MKTSTVAYVKVRAMPCKQGVRKMKDLSE